MNHGNDYNKMYSANLLMCVCLATAKITDGSYDER